jgi:Transglutaminase-like superfamily
VILGAWGGGLTVLVQREFYQSRPQQLAEAALRLSPGVTYFAVDQDGKQVGFASTTIDTLTSGFDAIDYFVADLPVAGVLRRSTARTTVTLSRALALRSFQMQFASSTAPLYAGGRADGDSAIVFAMTTGAQKPDSQRVRVRGAILPTLVPITIALGEKPKVGRHYAMQVFDPTAMGSGNAGFNITAESLFTLVDSARFDEDKGEWVSALTDTVRAWRVEPDGPKGVFNGWVDAQGSVVEATQPGGLTLKRMAYEVAFENWRIARDRAVATSAGPGDILERTAIAANEKPRGRAMLLAVTAKFNDVDLRGYDLDGGRQHFSGDTLKVVREKQSALAVTWSTAAPPKGFRNQFREDLAEEPQLQINDPAIQNLALILVAGAHDPLAIAQRINQWVYDSLQKVATFSRPNAVAVLHDRKGDANEHTQLYVALARSAGIPARIASGLAFVNGKFFYHTWPEVWLNDWVAVDPTFGQFPADAAHLRFVVGGLARQTELLRLIGNLKIKVLEAK